ncbi:MAG: hypothetical protein KDH90_22705, partial [Anaerolineae bacterium]|nr:hypothetical protein [Anaerolineae bacterium]
WIGLLLNGAEQQACKQDNSCEQDDSFQTGSLPIGRRRSAARSQGCQNVQVLSNERLASQSLKSIWN